MKIAQEENLRPRHAVIPVDDVEDAIRICNSTIYGLASAVWTNAIISKAHRVARGIKAGTVWINTYGLFDLFDPSVSYGGYKQSGFGRDLGRHSMEAFTEMRSVWVNLR